MIIVVVRYSKLSLNSSYLSSIETIALKINNKFVLFVKNYFHYQGIGIAFQIRRKK